MPATVPAGMRLELSRAKIVPGQEREAEAWMRTLNDRHDEGRETLGRERVPLQAAFFNREADDTLWLYYLSLSPVDAPVFDAEASEIDRLHAEYGGKVKKRGWEELQPMFFLVPEHIEEHLIRFGETGEAPDGWGD